MDGTVPPPAMQRARGAARVAWGARGLERLHQSGCAKLMVPRVAGRPEIVLLNTAGGLTGGDELTLEGTLSAGTLTATTQTAERAYASAGGAARVRIALTAGDGADLAWLPQETILYDGCALDRRTVIDMHPGARIVTCEALVLGRIAMGESVRRIDLRDRREIRVAGRPLLVEPLRLTPDALAPSPALLGGARALATVVVAGQGAEDAARRLDVRAEGVEAAASGWDGRAVLRMRATDPVPLRRALAQVLTGLVTLPRVWPR